MNNVIRKKRIDFYVHIKRIDSNSLTKRIIDFEERSENPNKWLREIQGEHKLLKVLIRLEQGTEHEITAFLKVINNEIKLYIQ